MRASQNPNCCSGNCDQGRNCPALSHGMAPPIDDRSSVDGVVAGSHSASLKSPAEGSGFLAGFVLGMALTSLVILVGSAL